VAYYGSHSAVGVFLGVPHFQAGGRNSEDHLERLGLALTDTEIKRAKSRENPYSMSDSGGLHLEITPAGGKLWRWKYRFEGKEKLMALGKYPQISLAVARERHSDGRSLLASGMLFSNCVVSSPVIT
jgi:hypothetical protein